MTFNEYIRFTRTTAIYPAERTMEYLLLGLASEVGELMGVCKKEIRDDQLMPEEFEKELGDIFWYLARLLDEEDISLVEVLDKNKRKLESRQQRGVLQGSGDNR